MFNLTFLVIYLLVIKFCGSWNLTDFGLDQSTTPVKHITIIKNRAYLSIPRKKNDQLMTFIETPWPETSRTFLTSRLFPDRRLQVLEDCDSLQSAICSDTDLGGKLYVLDEGYGHCPPKLVIYDGVMLKKVIGTIYDLKNVNGAGLNTMVVDTLASGGPKVYIGYSIEEGLIVFSTRDHHWWFAKLTPPSEIVDIYPQKFKLVPHEMTMSKKKPTLYFASNDTDYLFSINVQYLRSLPTPQGIFCEDIQHETTKLNVNFEGHLMGVSQGLSCDAHYGLYYFIPRFSVLVNWDSRKSLIAENHMIVIQSTKIVPQVKQIISDLQSVWILLGVPNEKGNHCVKLQILNLLN